MSAAWGLVIAQGLLLLIAHFGGRTRNTWLIGAVLVAASVIAIASLALIWETGL